jgi:mono/diheme cytochrome c family protein
MARQALLSATIALVALAPLGALAADKIVLKSVDVDLPAGDRMFPDRPGSEAANNNCLACHSAGMVLTQPALTAAQWRDEVEKMRHAYKAPIDAADVDKIVDYLVSLSGPK